MLVSEPVRGRSRATELPCFLISCTCICSFEIPYRTCLFRTIYPKNASLGKPKHLFVQNTTTKSPACSGIKLGGIIKHDSMTDISWVWEFVFHNKIVHTSLLLCDNGLYIRLSGQIMIFLFICPLFSLRKTKNKQTNI